MQPQAVPDTEVRAELDRVLASTTFGGANRSATLLKFLVEVTLAGRAQSLKEYTLGAEALGRGADFDPRVDPIARVEASRLRARLELYYATEGVTDRVVITLPKGSYVPHFGERVPASGVAPGAPAPPGPRTVGLRTALAFVGFVVAAAAFGIYLSFAAPWRERAPALQPLVQFDALIGAPGTVAQQVGSSIGFTPDGEKLVVQVLHADGGTSLFVRRLDQLTAAEIPGTFGAGGAFFFSPDSRWVAFFADGKLKKTLIDGRGSPLTLTDAADLLGGSWSEGGTIVAVLSRENILWRLSEDGGKPGPVLDFGPDGAQPRWPQLLPGGRAVLYSSAAGRASTGASVQVALLDGTLVKTVLPSGTHARYVQSGHVVYLDRGTLFAVAFDLERLEARSDPVPVLRDITFVDSFGFGHYDVAANGAVAYLRSTAGGMNTIAWLDGGDASRPVLAEPNRYLGPRLSPDGRQLAYTLLEGSDTDLWTLDLASGTKRRLTVGGGAQFNPVWSPDGKHLVYADDTLPALFAQRADEAGEPQLLVPGLNVPWSFTADGTRLAYHGMSSTTGFDLWTVPLEPSPDGLRAGTPVVFRALQTYETYPGFSPDGRFVTHGSNESGAWEVYVRSYPDGGAAQRISANGGRISIWAKDGAHIFYETSDQRLMVVPYRIDGGAFVAEPAHLWSTKHLADTGVRANFDVAPDGKSVVALLDHEAERQPPRDHVSVVVNFFDELRRRVP